MINSESENQQSVGKLIGEISRASHVFFQHQFKDYSLGHAQVRTLHFLSHNNGITQAELIDFLKLDKSSVTSQLNSLEKNGYIKRIISKKDARNRTIHITNKTQKIFGSLKSVYSSWTDILLNNFEEEDKTKLFTLLNKMQDNANSKINDFKINEEKK